METDRYTYEHDGLTCLLFPFSDDISVNTGKLAMWRLRTHGSFGGTWLSDYVPNRLGGFISSAESVAENDEISVGDEPDEGMELQLGGM